MARVRVGVVGAGIVGLAIARRLTESIPEIELTVMDKELAVAAHQTSHNSGVAHAGLYYAPGSLKAILCRRGITALKEYCAHHGITYSEIGKVVVARDRDEIQRLAEIELRATANGVPGLRRLTSDQLSEIEPHVRGVAALHSPTTAIVDFPAVARSFAREIQSSGGTIRLGYQVSAIDRRGGEVRITAASGEELVFDRVVTCAGLQADRIARLAGDSEEPSIIPFRGEYLRLIESRRDLVRSLIYPVPDPRFPFLGVHFTPRVDGSVDIGPNAVPAFAREGYRRRDFSLSDVRGTLGSAGFRRLARTHWQKGVRELWGSCSRRAYLAEARRFIPELALADVESAPAGVRAQALNDDGSLLDDFCITHVGPITLVRNAPSPAATSSLAIADYVVDRALEHG